MPHKLSIIAELSNRLAASEFWDVVRFESQIGKFCMSFNGPDGNVWNACWACPNSKFSSPKTNYLFL